MGPESNGNQSPLIEPSGQTVVNTLMAEINKLNDRRLYLEAQVAEYDAARQQLLVANIQQAEEITRLTAQLDQASAGQRPEVAEAAE